MKTFRFGCLGCGAMGKLHVRNALYVPGMEVVAFADVDKGRAEQFLSDYGGRYATDDIHEVLADDAIDAVLIQTGPATHAQLGIAAARAGKHIFSEKPCAATIEQAIELEEAVREAGVRYLVGLCNRLAPAVVRAKRLLPNPWISYCQCMDSVIHQACHNLDLAVHLFHDEPLVSVYATGGKHYDAMRQDPDLDSFVATLRFEDGSQSCYIQHGDSPNGLLSKYHFQLFAAGRCVYLAHRFKEIHLSTSLGEPDLSFAFRGPDFSPELPPAEHEKDVRGPHGYMGHYEELVALCEAIRADTDPPMTVEQGRHVLQVEMAIRESISTGRAVDHPAYLSRWNSRQPRASLRRASTD